MISEILVFFIMAAIILIGFFSHLFFERTNIPSFLLLIFIGIVVAPLNIITREEFIPLMEIFSSFTLIMVTFYSGLNLSIRDIIYQSGRALIQSSVYILSSVFLIGLACNILLGWKLVEAFIFSSMTGGEITAAVVVPLAFSLGLSDELKSILTLESAISTILTIVLFFAFLNQWLIGTADLYAAASMIAANFSIALIFGTLFSIASLRILYRYKEKQYTYVLTIGLALAIYTFVKWMGGNGELAVLIFGLSLSNNKIVSRVLNLYEDISAVISGLRQFQNEISFLLETFFFVFLGLVFIIDPSFILTGLMYSSLFLLILLFTRYIAVSTATYKSQFTKDRLIITIMAWCPVL
jgi:NhaP-type Na+/H+ or K+/H+ antiporter